MKADVRHGPDRHRTARTSIALRIAPVLALLLAVAPSANAQPDLYDQLTDLERSVVDAVMAQRGLELDTNPDGERFGRLIIVNQDVFTDEPSWLYWLNAIGL